MKTITKILLAASVYVIAGSANAMPITGSIGFSGAFSHNGPSLGDATEIIINSAQVTGFTSGAFSGVSAGDSVSYSNFTFSPTGPVADLWSVGDFSFDLTTMNTVLHSNHFLLLSGTGTINGPTGYDATVGNWGFSANALGSNFTWSDSYSSTVDEESVSVPEPAITLLLGVGLLGMSLSRKARKA